MKVKDLIEFLNGLDPEMETVCWNGEFDCGFHSEPAVIDTLEWEYHLGGKIYQEERPWGYEGQRGRRVRVVKL